MKQIYVAGFAFNGDRVLLIEKTKPEWQAGKLNGIGGKVEKYDHDEYAAQCREFWEETGISTNALNWTKFDVERFDHAEVHWFFNPVVNIDSFIKTTEEQPVIVRVSDVIGEGFNPYDDGKMCLYNLPYLLLKAWTFVFNGGPHHQIPNLKASYYTA